MSDPITQPKTAPAPEKKTVVVKSADGVTFGGKPYKKGDSIQCTSAQADILQQQGVI